MTTQSEAWKQLADGKANLVSDEYLAQSYHDVNSAIYYLSKIGEDQQKIDGLTKWSNKIAKIQHDRQAANRPDMPPRMDITIRDGHIYFCGLPGGTRVAGPNEQTEQLRKQLEAVYETTTMVKRRPRW